jgi:transposase
MLKTPTPAQQELEMVTLEMLVPQNHLLRQLDAAIDFSFIRHKVAHLYSADNGRPALDPVVLFKILFIGYLFGVRSERQLMREIEVNVAYRWFLGFRLTDKVPDASTLSQNRRRRFADSTIYQEIFDEIVLQAMQRDMIGGTVLYTDSTHLKANANKNKYDTVIVSQTPVDYLADLEREVDAIRAEQGKKPLQRDGDGSPPTREIKQSTTDSDAGYMVREGKPKGFFYLDHRTVDGRHAIITDTYVTPGNVHDSLPYLQRLDRQCERFGFTPGAVGLDAGYFTAGICKGLEDRGIEGVMGYRRPHHVKGTFYKRQFFYDAKQACYVCPVGQALHYSTTNRLGYHEYKSDAAQCRQCPERGQCTQSVNAVKVVTRHIWQSAKERVEARRLTPSGKQLYARRKETVERSFADAKQLHGHRYARMRGLHKVMEQCLLAAACQNMKKIALLLARLLALLNGHFSSLSRLIPHFLCRGVSFCRYANFYIPA